MKFAGKLENTSYGKYVEKAEGLLHQYSEPDATKETPEAEKEKADAPAPKEGIEQEPEKEKSAAPAPKEGNEKEPEKNDESGGGLESYVKLAEGFVNKEGGDSVSGESGGGLGGATKLAGQFFR